MAQDGGNIIPTNFSYNENRKFLINNVKKIYKEDTEREREMRLNSCDSHEHYCYLESEGLKSIDNSMSHSLVNRSSGFLCLGGILC